MKQIAYPYLNTPYTYPKPVPNGYQNYSWVSPKKVVKLAKRQTRSQGIFPIALFPSRSRTMGSHHGINFSVAKNMTNIAVGAFCLILIVFSVMTILTSQPQGEVPQESVDADDDVPGVGQDPMIHYSREEGPAHTLSNNGQVEY